MITEASIFSVDAPWKHQVYGVEQTINAISNGERAVCLTSPTGSGKTEMQMALIRWALNQGKRVALFMDRILLTQQTIRVYSEAGIPFGVRSAQMEYLDYRTEPVQICTIQTVKSRIQKDSDEWVDADVVIVDEAHKMATGGNLGLLSGYLARGAKIIGVTATPLGLGLAYDKLVCAAGTWDLIKERVLARAIVFAPSELDTRKLTSWKVDLSMSEAQARKTWGTEKGKKRASIIGNILKSWQSLNETRTHTIAFAPGVQESLWAARWFTSMGYRALHVDGTDFWCDGEMHDRRTENSLFEELMQQWRDGEINIIWNRFVLREGIDEPLIKNLILATPVGSHRSYLQMVGRALRRSELTPETVTVTDHGGNWWRWGSPNANQDWDEAFATDDANVLAKNRISRIRETGKLEGVACPHCGALHNSMKKRLLYCEQCGAKFDINKPCRNIIHEDGKLKLVSGKPIDQWKIKDAPSNEGRWRGLYWNAMKKHGGELTFNQLYQQFFMSVAREAAQGTRYEFAPWKAHHPPRNLPLMPKRASDWHRKIANVPKDALY